MNTRMNTRINTSVPINNYQIHNYDISLHQHLNLYKPGVVFQMNPVKEDIQNKEQFNYSIPILETPLCLKIDMRPRDTRHDLLGLNDCERIKNSLNNENAHNNIQQLDIIHKNQECDINPFVPSWNKYSSSINTESDMKNIFRKISCESENIYIPSSNSVMYSKLAMPRDSTLLSGHVALKEQERLFGTISRVFMEDTRQTRMGV
jgi:hypothetical protein